MKAQNDRLSIAVIASIFLHLLLIGLFLLGSLLTKTALQSAGGSGGETESFEAVMVDTGQVAAEYGKIKAKSEEKSTHKPQEQSKGEAESKLEEQRAIELAEQKAKAVEFARQQKLEQEKRLKEEQRQQELVRQEQIKQAELKKKQEIGRAHV